MKTTIDIADDLFARSRKAAKREGKTLRALMEEGLRLALQARAKKTAPKFHFPVYGSGGMTDEFKNASWADIRNEIYGLPPERDPPKP